MVFMATAALGDALRRAAEIGTANSEPSMYPTLVGVLDELLPPGFRAISHASSEEQGQPDIGIESRRGGVVAWVEVKLPSTSGDVFVPNPVTGRSQAEKYRDRGQPLLLTTGINWFDISVHNSLDRPVASLDEGDDEVGLKALADFLAVSCGVRPRYSLASAVFAVASLVELIDRSDAGDIAIGWETVRVSLGMNLQGTLDTSGPGEIATFTLLAVATQLPDIPIADFVEHAEAEWRDDTRFPRGTLPSVMEATLREFLDSDRRYPILGPSGWAIVRAVAAWLSSGTSGSRWDRLSDLWDSYLDHIGQRRTLGSWQTPPAVSRYQGHQVHEALQRLGYRKGLADPKVTVMDPCCGTGVYLEAVAQTISSAGFPPQSLNASSASRYSRLIGVDISATAVAATHIRMSVSSVKPNLYMTDTLRTGQSAREIRFGTPDGSFNGIVMAARDDHDQVDCWAKRDADRPPVLAILGNPPYQRGGLDMEAYQGRSWFDDVYGRWRPGSGRGVLQDPYVAFWAWAVDVCGHGHSEVEGGTPTPVRPFGVLSFITNRSWIHLRSFAAMRDDLARLASRIEITDFGPGTRGGGAGGWSDQPFAIEVGTAIVTVTFDLQEVECRITYRRARWENGEVRVEAEDTQTAANWLGVQEAPSLVGGLVTTNGIMTSDNQRWIQTVGDRDFATPTAFRAFDNRWSPTTPPEMARRGEEPLPHQAKYSARWAEAKLFNPHHDHVSAGGWYAILQRQTAHPGPAIHATRLIPDSDFFNVRGGVVVKVGAGHPSPVDYRVWADHMSLGGEEFWFYALAACNHVNYWTPRTAQALQLAERRVEVPLSDDPLVVAQLVEIGRELVDLWTMDPERIKWAPPSGRPGSWHFQDHEKAEEIRVNGRAVLSEWRDARPGDWGRARAEEYARSVASLLRVRDLADVVAGILQLGEPHDESAGVRHFPEEYRRFRQSMAGSD